MKRKSEKGGADRNSTETGVSAMPERPRIVAPVLFGLIVSMAFFGGLLGWSALAELSSAAVAPGVVKVESNRKTVQHLEGGIVGKIHIAEGVRVAKGQVLIELDQTKLNARLALLEGQIEADEQQLKLLNQEIDSVSSLLDQGLAAKPRLLGLQRRAAEIEGNRKRLLAQKVDAEDALARSKIRASIDGTIVGLKVHTAGGVISAGEELMNIVPRDERLIVEATVDPIDIDVVHAGLEAMVYLKPYNRRSMTPINGRVLSLSADHMTDERSGRTYYLARIELTEDPASVFDGAYLYPGMPTEVMIVTGSGTLLDFLLQPVIASFNRAFRES